MQVSVDDPLAGVHHGARGEHHQGGAGPRRHRQPPPRPGPGRGGQPGAGPHVREGGRGGGSHRGGQPGQVGGAEAKCGV